MWKLVSTEVHLLYALRCGSAFLTMMSLLVDEVAMYLISATFISVNGCALIQFASHGD